MVVEQNRRLAVILAADIVGYSRLMASDEEATVQALVTYQDVIGAPRGRASRADLRRCGRRPPG